MERDMNSEDRKLIIKTIQEEALDVASYVLGVMGPGRFIKYFFNDLYPKLQPKMQQAAETYRHASNILDRKIIEYSNEKYTVIVPKILKEKYNIRPGSLVKCNNRTLFAYRPDDKKPDELFFVSKEEIVLYLGIVQEKQNDTICAKFLYKNKILLFPKKENIILYVENLQRNFQPVNPGTGDK
jgi:bifunctional DNA-binding transcriptional regulator/antitoxin component of YhaV-PrlF toxin-antitoxin module